MDKNALALATALTFSPAQAEPVDAPKTQISIMQQMGRATVLSDPRTEGHGLRIEARRGDITFGVENIHDKLVTGHGRTWSFDTHYQNTYIDTSAAGSYGASLQHTYTVDGKRVTLDKSMNLGNLGNTKIDAKLGLDVGYVHARVTSVAGVFATLDSTRTTITPTEAYQKDADDVLKFFDFKKGDKLPTLLELPVTKKAQAAWTADGKTPYGGLSGSITGTIPLSQNFTANAQIGGRLGAEKTTSQICLGTVFTKNAGFSTADGLCDPLKPTGKSSGYYASLAVQREQTHRDLALKTADRKAGEWADSANGYIQTLTQNPDYPQLAQNPYYQQVAQKLGFSATDPKITKDNILAAFGINPHLRPQTSVILQGGKTFDVGPGPENLTAFAKIAIPMAQAPGAKPSAAVGLSYNF